MLYSSKLTIYKEFGHMPGLAAGAHIGTDQQVSTDWWMSGCAYGWSQSRGVLMITPMSGVAHWKHVGLVAGSFKPASLFFHSSDFLAGYPLYEQR